MNKTIEERLSKLEAQVFGSIEQTSEQPRLKTRIQWLNELPDGYRQLAVANCKEWVGDKPTDECNDMAQAIDGMCDWSETSEGDKFWLAVYEYYAVGSPLPPLPQDEPTEPTKPTVYNAGFWFSESFDGLLNLPDKTMLWMTYTGWAKANRGGCEPQPHTLTLVSRHTVGRFYAIAGASGERLNDWRNYALCVGEGKFVNATDEDGVVVVERVRQHIVTLSEVTPYNQ